LRSLGPLLVVQNPPQYFVVDLNLDEFLVDARVKGRVRQEILPLNSMV
jgi:hypothetical protein